MLLLIERLNDWTKLFLNVLLAALNITSLKVWGRNVGKKSAQINIENHGLTEQVIPIESDVFSGVEGLSYDLIVTNPPYVDQEDVDALPQEYLHEPVMGLGSGFDGLDIVREILAQAVSHLNDNGVLICEVGNSQIHVEFHKSTKFCWISPLLLNSTKS